VKHYSLRTEEAYTGWVLRFLKFHRDQSGEWKHPRDLGSAEVVGFLNHLASAQAVSAATQNQALNAIVFLYSQVLGVELGDLGEFLQASRRKRLPVGATSAGCPSRWLPSAGSGAVWDGGEADGAATTTSEGCRFRQGADHGARREGG